MAERIERRLTTILAADVAEYSRLMRWRWQSCTAEVRDDDITRPAAMFCAGDHRQLQEAV
ncbi:MAG: hypothetical protein ACJ8AH_07790 [Stellaceae bacterium]